MLVVSGQLSVVSYQWSGFVASGPRCGFGSWSVVLVLASVGQWLVVQQCVTND